MVGKVKCTLSSAKKRSCYHLPLKVKSMAILLKMANGRFDVDNDKVLKNVLSINFFALLISRAAGFCTTIVNRALT